MSMAQESHAAATAVVGFDLLQNSIHRQSDKPRRIIAAGLAGSAAALDTIVEVYIGRQNVATLYNTKTGAPNKDDMMRIDEGVPAGVEVRAVVKDAPATNPINLFVDFQGG